MTKFSTYGTGAHVTSSLGMSRCSQLTEGTYVLRALGANVVGGLTLEASYHGRCLLLLSKWPCWLWEQWIGPELSHREEELQRGRSGQLLRLPRHLGHTGDDLLVQTGRCCLLSKLPLHCRETPLDQNLWHTGHGPFMKLA